MSKQETITAAEYQRQAKRPKSAKESERVHRLFAMQVRARGLPEPRWKFGPGGELWFAQDVEGITRYKPGKTDRAPAWRFDFAWPEQRIAVEYQGLNVFKDGEGKMRTSGGHADVQHIRKQHEKHAWATVLGWRVLFFERDMVKGGYAIDMLVRLFAALEVLPVVVPKAEQWSAEDIARMNARGNRPGQPFEFNRTRLGPVQPGMVAPCMVDGVRHHPACAILHTPAGHALRAPCDCEASRQRFTDELNFGTAAKPPPF